MISDRDVVRILLLSFFFPPYDTIASVRTGKTAKYLTKMGYTVRVIAADDPNLPFKTLPLEIPEERVIYVPWLNVSAPFRKIARKIFPIALGKILTTPAQSTGLLDIPVFRWLHSALLLDIGIGWLIPAIMSALQIIPKWRPDVILASSGPTASLLIAAFLSKRYQIPWVADLRDLWTDNHYLKPLPFRMWLDKYVERKVLSSASGLTTVSSPLADTLKKFGRPVSVVLNGFDPVDYPRSYASGQSARHRQIHLVYTGTVYKGRQTAAPLFQALNLLDTNAEKIQVTFYGASGNLMREEATKFGVEHLVDVVGIVPRFQSLEAQCRADILLHLLWMDPLERGVYTAKIFEYFGARRPVLAVGYTDNITADLIRERNAGVTLHDPLEIAKQLEFWLKQKEEYGSIPPLDITKVSDLTREEQTRKMGTFIRKVASTLNGKG